MTEEELTYLESIVHKHNDTAEMEAGLNILADAKRTLKKVKIVNDVVSHAIKKVAKEKKKENKAVMKEVTKKKSVAKAKK